MSILLAASLALAGSPASAASCDGLVAKAEKASGTEVAAAFSAVAACDKQVAEDNYTRFMARATDADSLVALSAAAIESNVWNPVWLQLGKISDYEARDIVAEEVGASCTDSAKVVSFLQGAYFGLRDTDFARWKQAFAACESTELGQWLETQVAKPPSRQFDDKFDALMGFYVNRVGADALPTLTTAATAAAESGPFDAILIKMDESVAPALGQELSADDQARLEASLIEVARAVSADKARSVADRLANAGSQAAAAELLPAVYPDRVQSGGGFLYGAAAIELGECDGEKSAILHIAEVYEPGKRWIIQGDTETPMRTFKPKLKKCTAEGSDWAVAITAEPVASSKDISPWVEGLESSWAEKGYTVKVQNEKSVTLP